MRPRGCKVERSEWVVEVCGGVEGGGSVKCNDKWRRWRSYGDK